MTPERVGSAIRARRWVLDAMGPAGRAVRRARVRSATEDTSAARSQLDEIAARLSERSSSDGATARRLDLISAEIEELVRRLDVLAAGQVELSEQMSLLARRVGLTHALATR